jgi:hypothetical protein
MINFYILILIIYFSNCLEIFENVTPKDLISEFDYTQDYQLYSFDKELYDNFTTRLQNISDIFYLSTYIYYIKNVTKDYDEIPYLDKFMKEFVSLLNLTKKQFENSFITVISIYNKNLGIYIGKTYKQKFTKKNKNNVDILKDYVKAELIDIKNFSTPIEILIKNLENGLNEKDLEPGKNYKKLIFILICVAVGLIIIAIICCCCCSCCICCCNNKKKITYNSTKPLLNSFN